MEAAKFRDTNRARRSERPAKPAFRISGAAADLEFNDLKRDQRIKRRPQSHCDCAGDEDLHPKSRRERSAGLLVHVRAQGNRQET